jgi:hypothetical protein
MVVYIVQSEMLHFPYFIISEMYYPEPVKWFYICFYISEYLRWWILSGEILSRKLWTAGAVFLSVEDMLSSIMHIQ